MMILTRFIKEEYQLQLDTPPPLLAHFSTAEERIQLRAQLPPDVVQGHEDLSDLQLGWDGRVGVFIP